MRINLEYLRKLLLAFEDSDKAYTNIIELEKKGINYNSEEFVFHIQILVDKSIIETETGSKEIGLSRTGNGQIFWIVRNLRLTADGHDFLESLKNKTIWLKLKKELKDNSLTTIIQLSKTLLTDFISKKII